MKTGRWMAGLLGVALLGPRAGADILIPTGTNVARSAGTPAATRAAAPISPAAPPVSGTAASVSGGAQVGRALAVDLGAGEVLAFVWIGPLGLWAGQYEVTNGQYRRYDPSHESTAYYGHGFDAPDQPVVQVSWEDANNFCAWLTRRYRGRLPAGYVLRLPAHAEWRAFAACGDGRPYPWGRDWPPPNTVNVRGAEGIRWIYQVFQRAPYIRGHNDGSIVTCPVARSGANAWGLYGVGGNVWEWCATWADARKLTRSLCGGCWDTYEPDVLPVAYRADAHPDRRNAMIGFRVVVARALP